MGRASAVPDRVGLDTTRGSRDARRTRRATFGCTIERHRLRVAQAGAPVSAQLTELDAAQGSRVPRARSMKIVI